MKLVTFRHDGEDRVGVLGADGAVHDLAVASRADGGGGLPGGTLEAETAGLGVLRTPVRFEEEVGIEPATGART